MDEKEIQNGPVAGFVVVNDGCVNMPMGGVWRYDHFRLEDLVTLVTRTQMRERANLLCYYPVRLIRVRQ